MMVRRGGCPIREEIVYGSNVEIMRFKKGEGKRLIVESWKSRIGKLEIVWDRL